MATKRGSYKPQLPTNNSSSPGTSNVGMKWNRPQERTRETAKGNKPLPGPVTVKQVMMDLVMHICRRILLRDVYWRLGTYVGAVFLGSLVCDVLPIPRTYFGQKSNVFNQYFVKIGWGWTLLVVGGFITLTSAVYCCGDRNRIGGHLSRLAAATGCWYVCTGLFEYVEKATAICVGGSGEDRYNLSMDKCLNRGHKWRGFDISGHTFILIYCSMIIQEEARCIRGWENIGDMIRNEEYDEDSPLKNLTEFELTQLKKLYELLYRYVKAAFVLMTVFSVFWDFMLCCTIVYFHTVTQKVAGAFFAILVWCVTYKIWFPSSTLPGLPGQGPFRYLVEPRASFSAAAAPGRLPEYRRRSLTSVKQMRMALNANESMN